MSLSLFDYLDDLCYGKKDLSRLYPDEFAVSYVPYVINRAFSMGGDTILYANEMNKYPEMSKQAQYDFYLNTIRKRKRRFKWAKTDEIEYVADVSQCYQVTEEKARDIVRILSDGKLNEIHAKLNKGGKSR